MEQSITIRIAGKEFPLKANSPREEELIRRSAEAIGKMIAAYQSKYPTRELTDILSFVALNEGINALRLQQQLEAAGAEAEALTKDITTYLEGIA